MVHGAPALHRPTPGIRRDDKTDEDGFAAVRALHGLAIRVGRQAHSLAQCHLGSPHEFRNWLRASCAALEGSR